MKHSCLREKEIYFCVLLGIQLIPPSNFEMACICRWESQLRILWKTTGMVVVLGFSRSLRLQALWGCPSIFSCNVAVVTHRVTLEGFSHMWHVSVVRKACQSSRLILMALESASTPLILSSSSCSDSKLCCVGTSIFDWRLCLAIIPHHDVAITTSLVVLCPLSIALRGVRLMSLDFGGESLKVGVDDIRGWQLLVGVLKSQLVFTFFWHLHPYSRLADPTTFWLVGF